MVDNALLFETVRQKFAEVCASQISGSPVPEIDEQTVMLETGLDSLGFAILVTELEDELGYDPFTLSEEAYYPSTFGELVSFYESNRPT